MGEAELQTGVSAIDCPIKNVGHFFGLSYVRLGINYSGRKKLIRISNNSHKASHAQHGFRNVIKKLRTFFGHRDREIEGSRSLSVTAMLKNVDLPGLN